MKELLKVREHSFQPGAMSIIQMGEELIGHPSTAINELVKNGYDADALKCYIYFYYDSNISCSFAAILDTGTGMDDKTLFGDWLKPSVSSKRKKNAKSAVYNRSLLGSKGIGRLAAMALGERVTVISKKEQDKRYNWVTVSRDAFKEEKLLSEIYFPGDQIENYLDLFTDDFLLEKRYGVSNQKLTSFLKTNDFFSFNEGTLILIEKLDDSVLKILKDDFNRIELPENAIEAYKNTSFYKSLATLITPLNLNSTIQNELLSKKLITNKKSISDAQGVFSVKYGTNLLPNQNNDEVEWLDVDPIPIHNVFDYRLYGKVTENGDVKGFLSYHRLENDIHEEEFDLSHKDINDKVKVEENITQASLFDAAEMESPKIDDPSSPGEYYFDIRVYDIGEGDNLKKLARLAQFDNTLSFRNAFKDFQGLRISKNGFGVKPYGEEVVDWIELSKARVQDPGHNVNTNQILGYIFFYSPENDALEEKTNREGFLENKAFISVKKTLRSVFSLLGKKRYNYRLWNNLGRVPSSKHGRPDFEEFIRILGTYNASSKVVSYTEKFMKDVTTAMDNLEESLSFSERLATLGTGLELVYHEMAQPISGLRTTRSSLDFKKTKIDSLVLDSFTRDLNTLDFSTDTLVELRKSLQPAIGKTRKKKFKPYNTFMKVCNLYKSDLDKYNIKVIVDERLNDYELLDLEYAFWITFLNIANNAVYWIKKSERSGEIRFYKDGDDLVISNSGPLIDENIIDIIFSYGVTSRKEKNATGLGLAFTQSVLSRNSWEITAVNKEDGPAFIIKSMHNG